ncbi:MAG TPA: hypothetical protein VF260_05045 [Bacilli bacterium]
MRQFNRLLATDFRNVRNLLVIVAAIIVVAHVAFLIATGSMSETSANGWFVAVNGLIIGTVVIVPIVLSFTIWSKEWELNTHYVLFSLPVPRWYILLSKLIVVVSVFLTLCAFAVFGYFMDISLHRNFPELIGNLSGKNVFYEFLNYLVAVNSAMLGYLAGKSLPKLRGLVTFILFIALVNIPNYIMGFPIFTVRHSATQAARSAAIPLDQSYWTAIIVLLLVNLLYIVASGVILKKRIEL